MAVPLPLSPAHLLVGPPQMDFSLFQFDDVIDNIMRLDDVLGYINPEMQMPNTVLLARVGWVCKGSREGGTHSGSEPGESWRQGSHWAELACFCRDNSHFH